MTVQSGFFFLTLNPSSGCVVGSEVRGCHEFKEIECTRVGQMGLLIHDMDGDSNWP